MNILIKIQYIKDKLKYKGGFVMKTKNDSRVYISKESIIEAEKNKQKRFEELENKLFEAYLIIQDINKI